MAAINVVCLSQLSGTTGKRIDAEYYDPESVEIESFLRHSLSTTLRNVGISIDASAFYPSIAEHYKQSGVPFLRVSDVAEGLVKCGDIIFLSEGLVDKLPAIRQASPGDIVITKGGTVGITALLSDDFPRYALSRDMILIRSSFLPMRRAISMMLFLVSKFGKFQLLRGKSQQVQPHLTIPLVKSLLVPDSIMEDAVDSYLSSVSYLKKSETFYLQAENLLLEELGLKDFKPKYELSYAASLSKAFGVHRVDAEYFQPAYEQVTEKVTSYKNGYMALLTCIESVRPDFDPAKRPDTNFHYVELADIDMSIGIIRSASETRGEEAPSRARRILKKGDVIVSSVEGSLEKVALVDGEYEGSLASTGFFQLRARGMNSEVLLVLSKSIVLQAQLKRECAGTILTAVPNESLKRIIIPILPLGVQQSIAELIRQSHEARKKVKELLEEAKKKVENLIEGGCQPNAY